MLTVKEHKPVYKNMDRVRQGTVMQCGSEAFVYLTGTPTKNGVPFYAVDVYGTRHMFKDCRPIMQNEGIKILERTA